MTEAGSERVASSGPGRRDLGLDLLRLAAIVLVIGRHFPVPPPDLPGPLYTFLATWRRGGGIGVDLFFVLSGFLIAGLLFGEYRKRGTLTISRFYIRRGWKLYPPFFVMLAFTAASRARQGRLIGSELLAEVFFVQNYFKGMHNHTWSLAVEEHFYLFLPLALAFLIWRRRGQADPFRAIPAIGAAIATVAIALRLLNLGSGRPYANLTHVFPTHLRLDSLMFGVVLAYFYHFRAEWFRETFRPWRTELAVAGSLCLIPAFVPFRGAEGFFVTFGFTMLYLGGGAILIAVVLTDIPRTRAIGALAAVGSYSYSIYLWHMVALGRFTFEWPGPSRYDPGYVGRCAAGVVASFAMGIILSRLIEFPTLRLRDRLFPSRSGSIISHAAEPDAPRPGAIQADSAIA